MHSIMQSSPRSTISKPSEKFNTRNVNHMHKLFPAFLFATALLAVSCDQGNPIEKKKKEVQDLKDQLSKAEADLAKIDTTNKKENTKLVAVTAVVLGDFTHYIDLQGKVDALNIANVAPANGTGGAV